MNLTESLRTLTDRLIKIDLVEAKGHLDHPEDLVFLNDIAGANEALNNIVATAKNPNTVTVKWDGYPALIFGRGSNGKFSIMDKHMFNKAGGAGREVYSPKDFIKYDAARGVDRTDLARIITEIWPGLEKASSGSNGYYWGDLLFGHVLTPNNDVYTFKANPNGITYTVDSKSDLGKLMTNKKAGIAVHQYLDPNAATTDDAQTLNGTIGRLKNNSDVAIIPSAMPTLPKLKTDATLVRKAKDDINKYGPAIQQLMTTAPQARNTFNGLFTTFINQRVRTGDLKNLYSEFIKYFETRPMTAVMKQKLLTHLKQNKEGLVGAFTVWIDLYNLKQHLVHQLNQAAKSSPVKGYLQDGTLSHEGFVANGLKFVDRMGFSRQNLQGR
jgi:Family of unknown function (DUF6267)